MFEDDIEDAPAPKDKKRKNVTTFEIDLVTGEAINEHNGDNTDTFFDEEEDLGVEIEGDGTDELIVETPTPPAPPAAAAEDEKKTSRSNERIRALAKEKNDAKADARKAQQERDEYKAQLDGVSQLYLATEKDRLTKEFDTLKKDLARAAADQDTEEYARILPLMSEVTSKLTLLGQHIEATPAPSSTPPVKEDTSYSDAAENWMEGKGFIINNDEYAKLDPATRKKLYPVRKALADKARELIKEGWQNNTIDFYEELDMRMSLEFDFYEALALEGVDALQSEGTTKVETPKVPSSGETLTATRSVEDRKKNVPVNGPSSSGSQTSSRKNSQRVKLSKEDIRWWENHVRYSLGQQNEITLEEYAKMVMDERKKEAKNG